MSNIDKLQEIIKSATSEVIEVGASSCNFASTIRSVSRVALGLDPQADIAELPFTMQSDLLDVMRGVRDVVVSQRGN